MKTGNYTKYIVIALTVIFIIAAALLVLEFKWGKGDDFSAPETSDNSNVTYNDREYTLKENIESFLVIGTDRFSNSDTAESHESGVQADFLMLLVFDNASEKFTALHINRDTMVNVDKLAIGGIKVDTFTKQIALSYNYVADDNEKVKCGNVKTSVEHLLNGIKIDHYLSLTMDSVAVMNDFVGGVEVTVLDDFSSVDNTLVKGEKVILNGEQALRYVRARQSLENSDNISRMARQRQYIDALYEKAVSCISADEGFSVKLAEAMDEYVIYDSSDQKMQQYAEKLKNYEFVGIKEIEGESKKGEEFMEFYPDADSVLGNVIDLFYAPKA